MYSFTFLRLHFHTRTFVKYLDTDPYSIAADYKLSKLINQSIALVLLLLISLCLLNAQADGVAITFP